jgi:hypothetical protein
MRKPRSALVFLLLLSFGVFLTVPAEDLPETPYDESAGLPYSGTPVFSIARLGLSDRRAQAESNGSCWFGCKHLASRAGILENRAGSYRISVSLTIIDRSLRC